MHISQEAIPFLTRSPKDPDGAHAGTGFLGTLDGGTFFITAAHVPPGDLGVASDWSKWPPDVRMVLPQGSQVEVPLFKAGGEIRVPAFGHFHALQELGKLHDLMWIDLSQYEGLRRALRSSYTVFDLERSSSPAAGALLTCYGYPATNEDWPRMEAVSGRVIQVVPGGILCDLRTQKGHSGGPVLLADGGLAGLARGFISGPESDGVVLSTSDIALIMRLAVQNGPYGIPELR